MHCLGLPRHGSPLTFLHPQLPVDWRPHPSEEGRGRCSWCLLMALQVEVNQQQVASCAEMWCIVMWFCLHKHYSGSNCSISSKSNHLPSSPTSITPQKMWAGFGNTPQHLMDAGLASHCPHPPLCHITWHQASRTPLLVCSCPSLCHVTWCWASRMPPLVCLHPLLCHITMSSVEDASPGLPPPSSLPRHLTLSIEDASPACHCSFTLHFVPHHLRRALPLAPTTLDIECWGCFPRRLPPSPALSNIVSHFIVIITILTHLMSIYSALWCEQTTTTSSTTFHHPSHQYNWY